MMHYDAYGNRQNPTILLLHGAGVLDTFCRQYRFSDQYHLVVPHLAGAGKAVAKIYNPKKTIEELFALIESIHKKKIGVIGHSLGSQIAIMLVSEKPELFHFAVFLSAWINPKPKTIRMYCSFAGFAAKMLHWRWLVLLQGKYWDFTKEQAHYMADYLKQITPQVYASFFTNTLDLSTLPEYQAVTIPMLAICGSREVGDMKTSLKQLAQNPSCRIKTLHEAGHSLPMRNAKQLNPILERFIMKCL